MTNESVRKPDLRCCPFCDSSDVELCEIYPDGKSRVYCNPCKVIGPEGETPEEAELLWNDGVSRHHPIFTNAVLYEIDGV